MRYNFKSVARDGAGNIVPSATVSVYLAGTTTAASIYTALAGGTAVNSVTSGTDGSFEFYIDDTDYAGTQRFKITIAKSNYASVTRDYLTIFDINSVLDTDGTLAADSDDLVATQKATKTYADEKVSDTAYAASWAGVGDIAPSKNAVYDQIEAIVLGAAIVSDTAYGASWNGVTSVAPSKNAVYDQMELRYPKTNTTISNNNIQIGKNGSGNRYAYLYLIGDDTYSDYGLRILRDADGANAASYVTHRGTGSLLIHTIDAAPIAFYTTNTARMIIAAGGTVSMLSQPLFSVALTSTVENCTGVNNISTYYTLRSTSSPACNWTEITDRATNFSGGTFTAPVTGNYLFTGFIELSGLSDNTSWTIVHLITSNRTYTVTTVGIEALGFAGYGFSVIADMDTADTAYLEIVVYDGTNAKTVDITTSTHFQGYLLP